MCMCFFLLVRVLYVSVVVDVYGNVNADMNVDDDVDVVWVHV